MTKIIGLTGGIGSGKTTVAKEFEALGIPIYIADTEAKKIMNLPETTQLVTQVFGTSILENGLINRQKLAQIVFENPDELQKLNNIIHPLVKKHFEEWVQKKSNFDFIIKEVAILFESGSYKDCHKIITVVAPLEVRIERVLKRDNSDYQSIKNRIGMQWTDEMRIEKSDFVIENIDLNSLKNQVREIYQSLKDV